MLTIPARTDVPLEPTAKTIIVVVMVKEYNAPDSRMTRRAPLRLERELEGKNSSEALCIRQMRNARRAGISEKFAQ